MIELKHISKTFPTADGVFQALDDINLTIRDGDIFGIVGMSGAGKSTLVRCINLLERPTAGQVVIDGQDLMELSAPQLREKRRSISMIFQQFNLLMQRTWGQAPALQGARVGRRFTPAGRTHPPPAPSAFRPPRSPSSPATPGRAGWR